MRYTSMIALVLAGCGPAVDVTDLTGSSTATPATWESTGSNAPSADTGDSRIPMPGSSSSAAASSDTGVGAGDDDGTSSSTGVNSSATSGGDPTQPGTDAGEPIPERCIGAKVLQLSAAQSRPLDAELWLAGGTIEISAELYNAGPAWVDYPGIIAVADDPQITALHPTFQLFGLEPGTSMRLPTEFAAPDTVVEGTVVNFTVSAMILNDQCPNVDSVSIPVTLHARP